MSLAAEVRVRLPVILGVGPGYVVALALVALRSALVGRTSLQARSAASQFRPFRLTTV
jgi:predicted RNase H-like nuclease (RuvC/YqgF family)